MDDYQLIGLDQTEASIVRRQLHKWNKSDDQPILPLIAALQQRGYISDLHIKQPRWETNVYPLYFYWLYRQKVIHSEVYKRVFNSFSSVPEEQLRVHIDTIANTEIDILIEDADYFLFIEAKVPSAKQKIIFQNGSGVHQLVRQYVQGRLLAEIVNKRFALGTLGANNAQPIKIQLNETEQALIRLLGQETKELSVPDFAWTLIGSTPQAAMSVAALR